MCTDSIVLLQEQLVNLKVLSYHMAPSVLAQLHLRVG
jgi:hypothetical protein